MHEASLIADLLRRIDKIARREHAARVTGVSVWLGALTHFSADHFADHFDHASLGTIAEGASLAVTVSADMRHPNAQDILLDSIEVES